MSRVNGFEDQSSYNAETNSPAVMTDQDWLHIADQSYTDSDNYLDTGLRKRFERNYSLALSRHPSGSKYYSDEYKYRSKIFRGKTSASIRRNLAACAVALFSTEDVVSVEPKNDTDDKQVQASLARSLLMNHHLTSSIKWYRTCLGAYREAMVNGIVFSKQWWKYTIKYDEKGEEVNVVDDHPVIELIPPENVRISPAADWLDPTRTSPYIILIYPMYIGDIKDRMQLDWIEASDDQIGTAMNDNEYDSIRTAREENKPDSKSESVSVVDQDLAWVRENFIRHNGEFWVYYTIGRSVLLSEPVPVKEAYPHCKDGYPPIKSGVSEVEPFVVYPQSQVERTEGLQVACNNLVNQREDNVQQVLNKRFVVDRNGNVDYRALKRNVPGSITLADNIEAVKPLITGDVTSSSFQEQNLLNQDFDEQSGTFSTATIGSTRELGNSVGGAQLLSANANVLNEFQLKTFVESWVEPTLREVDEMVATYEETETIKAITGEDLTQVQLQEDVKTTVNVGFGATDPGQKINKLTFAMHTLKNFIPDISAKIDGEAVAAEVFGSAGFKNSSRFLPGLNSDEDPMVRQLKEQVTQMKQIIEQKKTEKQADAAIVKMKIDHEKEQEQVKNAHDKEEWASKERIAAVEQQNKMIELASREDLTIKQAKAMMFGKEQDNLTKKELKAMDGVHQDRKSADDLKGKIYLDEKTDGKAGGFYPG